MSLDWILLGLRVLATVILYAFLGLAFYIIWRDLKQAQGQVTTQFQATDQLPVVATPEKQSLVGGDTLLISIIIPTLNESDHMAVVLDRLVEQAGRFEVVIVDGGQPNNLLSLEGRARLVSTNHAGREAQFNAGAAAAKGDVLLFLDPLNRLPANALLAIERNFNLLPQTVGGNFHLKFDRDSLFTKLLARLLKWWRYRGVYYGHSGIFIRKEAFESIGGFQFDTPLADYDFVKRMEKHGPTLYLHQYIIAPAPRYHYALIWLIAPIFR